MRLFLFDTMDAFCYVYSLVPESIHEQDRGSWASHGYSQVSMQLDGCFVSLGIIVSSLLFVIVLAVSPVRFILSTIGKNIAHVPYFRVFFREATSQEKVLIEL